MPNYQVRPGHHVAGYPSGSVIDLDASAENTINWLEAGAITSNIDPTLEPGWNPDASGFYNGLASCPEYGAVFAYAVANPTTPLPFLIGVTIATAAEAKSYQQSGGTGVTFDRVDAALTGLIAALPATVGDYSKADIVAAIKRIADENRVVLPSV
jgi:hypothetical protein